MIAPEPFGEDPEGNDSQPYDFRNPSILSEPEVRKLRSEHESIAASIEALLSMYLRMEVSTQLGDLKTTTFRKLKETITTPAHFVMFKIEPLHGCSLLQVPPPLAISMVDRLMGGSGEAATVPEVLSEIEAALLDQVVQIILTEWSNHWKGGQNLKPFIVSHETNPRFLYLFSDNDLLLEVDLKISIGSVVEVIQIVFPYEMIEPLIRHLAEQKQAIISNTPPDEPLAWRPELDSLDLTLCAEWCLAQVPARRLVQLQVGDFFEIDPGLTEKISVKIGNLSKFAGRLGVQGKNWAVEITAIKS